MKGRFHTPIAWHQEMQFYIRLWAKYPKGRLVNHLAFCRNCGKFIQYFNKLKELCRSCKIYVKFIEECPDIMKNAIERNNNWYETSFNGLESFKGELDV